MDDLIRPEKESPRQDPDKKGDTDGNKNAESTSVHDCEDEEGVTSGPLQFVVHGLTGEQLQDMSADALKGAAMAHLKSRIPFVPSQDNTEQRERNSELRRSRLLSLQLVDQRCQNPCMKILLCTLESFHGCSLTDLVGWACHLVHLITYGNNPK